MDRLDPSVSPPPTPVRLRPDEDNVGAWVKLPPPNTVQQVDQVPPDSVVTEEERGRLAVVGYILCPHDKDVPVLKELSVAVTSETNERLLLVWPDEYIRHPSSDSKLSSTEL